MARAWYENQRPGLGEQFLACVDASFDAIERFPELSAPLRGDVRRAIVPRFPYAVFYRVEPRPRPEATMIKVLENLIDRVAQRPNAAQEEVVRVLVETGPPARSLGSLQSPVARSLPRSGRGKLEAETPERGAAP